MQLCDRCYCFFQGNNRMIKFVSVNEDLVSSMNLLGEEVEPAVAVKETLERLVCPLYQVRLKIDVNVPRCKLLT